MATGKNNKGAHRGNALFRAVVRLIANSTSASSGAEPNPGTNILKNGTVVTAVTGSPGGWIDDGHLLVNTFVEIEGLGINVLGYCGCSVYSPSGQSTGP